MNLSQYSKEMVAKIKLLNNHLRAMKQQNADLRQQLKQLANTCEDLVDQRVIAIKIAHDYRTRLRKAGNK